MTATGRHPAPTHLELIDLVNDSGPHVRAWHSPARWAQVATEHLVQPPTPTMPGPEAHSLAFRALLRDSGILGAPDAAERPRILLVGSGPLAARVAEGILPLCQELLLCAQRFAAPARPVGRGQAANATASWQAQLVTCSPQRRVALLRGDPLERMRPGTLVVVCADTIEADRGLLARLVRAGVDHVVVGAHHDRAWVGPFWTPDTPACAACRDHWLARIDADYPTVLAELCRRPALPDEVTISWAASILVAHLSRPGLGRATLAGRIEVFDRAEPLLHDITIQPHPGCPCRRRDLAAG